MRGRGEKKSGGVIDRRKSTEKKFRWAKGKEDPSPKERHRVNLRKSAEKEKESKYTDTGKGKCLKKKKGEELSERHQ